MRFKRLFLIPLIVVIQSLILHAQDEPVLHMSISTFSWSDPMTDLYWMSEGQALELKALPLVRSGPFRYVGSKDLLIYRGKPQLSEDGVAPKPVGRVELPSQGGRALLILMSPEGPGGRIIGHIVPEQEGDFPAGSCRFINLTQSAVNIAAALDDELFILTPGQTNTVMEFANEDSGGFKLRFAYQKAGGEWDKFYTGRWTQNPNLRTLFIITENPLGHFILRRISDRPRNL
ncbi:hypothetical protein QEH59_17255 [Coraliomargarita sp. SDUM461004]|uniref:Uncharacterized protein n=1 Tax=Thalassobacterium sedimentorum TaxID=3041258 RepID=A0ABU1AN07_9BACT|nr:hypothetical protein [Coraliomargarita sp. SDUM461004]MDQ8196186.1 hypothetical protein [Coraliomargarita sp. SDUM461004]